MKVVIDIECNGLENPDKIWLIVCKDIDTLEYSIFRNLTDDRSELQRFMEFTTKVDLWIGHNFLGYDYIVLKDILGYSKDAIEEHCIDTLVISKLVDYPRDKHSIEDYGIEFNYPKGNNTTQDFFRKYSKELEEYCIRDVDITHRIYLKYLKVIKDPLWLPSITMEQAFQYYIVNTLHNNGFAFDIPKAEGLLEKVTNELSILDQDIAREFPPRLKLIREITPKATKFGTISKSSVPRKLIDDIPYMSVDAPFSYCEWVEFNPSSHKQIVDVLHEAKWEPTERTKTYIDLERELNKLRYERGDRNRLDVEKSELYNKLLQSERYSWKINENNLSTLPTDAPSPARTLAKRILLESRRRTLTEWLGLVHPDTNRIHGKFYGIGAWTHRMAHQQPNTANIPTDAKLYGGEMRSLWRAPRNRLLVGVDAESIQLRIFAHYIDDADFTKSVVEGRKDDKTDPHSLNKRILGDVCKGRQEAKRFIYALLLGAGLGKLAEILGCSKDEAEVALGRLLERYQGFAYLKQHVIPGDAKRGWFLGLDGRKVRIPGDTTGLRKHLCMSGYLQNGEAVVMKKACLLWNSMLQEDKELWRIVNFVHDEWQTECKNDMSLALKIAKAQADSLRIVGEELNLKCPLAGSFWNEDHKDYTIGTNWKQTH